MDSDSVVLYQCDKFISGCPCHSICNYKKGGLPDNVFN